MCLSFPGRLIGDNPCVFLVLELTPVSGWLVRWQHWHGNLCILDLDHVIRAFEGSDMHIDEATMGDGSAIGSRAALMTF